MANKSPWRKVPIQTELEEDMWELQRELRAIQLRIDYLGDGYPSFRHPRKNIPELVDFEVDSEEAMVKLLDDILDGKI